MTDLPALVDAETLRDRLADPALRVLDASVVLTFADEGGPPTIQSGRPGYDEGHIPGAAFADLVVELSDPASPLPFMVPTPERFAAGVSRLGVAPDTHVVAYDQGPTMWATRLWWLLRLFGFDDVSVLDGGLPAWRAAGGEVSTEPSRYPAATFAPSFRRELLATRDDVLAAIEEGATCVVNALDRATFRGEGPQSLPRRGRIPGSVSLPARELLDPETGRLRPLEELREAVSAAGLDADRAPIAEGCRRRPGSRGGGEVATAAGGGPPVIVYCGGGIAASLDVFALALAGRPDARLYDGSLVEWTSDPSLPLETG